MIENNEYIDFLKTRKKEDIVLIKRELKDEIKQLKKENKQNKINAKISKSKLLSKIFGRKIINPMIAEKYNKKNELYGIVSKYLKNLKD